MSQTWSALPELPVPPPQLTADRLQSLNQAAAAERAAMLSLSRGGLNVVGEILKGQGTFYEMNHYPEGDVYDHQNHSQYYYHAHRAEEHGHFHTFVRRGGIPPEIQPAAGFQPTEPEPQGSDALAHLVCISMDADGLPKGLFATNRWVTGDAWFSADDTIKILDRFRIEHAYPNLAVNQWLTAFMRLCRPQIEVLLRHRDQVIAAWQQRQPGVNVLEDRALEVTGYLPIDIARWSASLTAGSRQGHRATEGLRLVSGSAQTR